MVLPLSPRNMFVKCIQFCPHRTSALTERIELFDVNVTT
jgi:hypothetical protein